MDDERSPDNVFQRGALRALVLPHRESRVLDLNAEALGVSVASLVERAGAGIADFVESRKPNGPILVLAGPGNNGADGLVAARLLHERGLPVAVMAPAPWKSPHAKRAAEDLPDDVDVQMEPNVVAVEKAIARSAITMDALVGSGLVGALRAPLDAWAAALSRHAVKVIAVDAPSGGGYQPGQTVALHAQKEGTKGAVHVVDVGIPREAELFTGPGEYALYPTVQSEQHKGEGGIVLVIGGGPYTGAPAVAGLAALRSGADLSIILTPKRSWSVIASYSPNLVVRPLERDELDFEDPTNRVTLNTWLKKAHSVVLGPGLGLFDTTQRAVHHVMERCKAQRVPVVVDADALTSIANRRDLLFDLAVVTPHAREFKTLAQRDLPSDVTARGEAARSAAKELGGTWLVKGPIDVITDGTRLKLNATGHPAMSVGGTGDALAGVVGCLLAKGLAPFDAARVGARLLGEAGELAALDKSVGLLATDVVEALPAVLARSLTKLDVIKRGIQ